MMFMHTVFHNFTVNIHFLLFMVNQIAVTNIAAWTKQETEHTVYQTTTWVTEETTS